MAITDLDKYKSFIQEGQAGYESTPGQLGIVDPGIRYDPRQHSYASDLYQYYLGGGMPPGGETGITTQVSGTTAQGTGEGGGIETVLSPGPALPDLGGAQNPLTQMITDPVTGETMTVRQAMTSDDAYRGTETVTPSMTDLETMARAQAATDPRYAADVAPTTVDGVPIQGRQNVTGGITGDPIDSYLADTFLTPETTQDKVLSMGAQAVANMPKYMPISSTAKGRQVLQMAKAGQKIPVAHGFQTRAGAANVAQKGFQNVRPASSQTLGKISKALPTMSDIERAVRTGSTKALGTTTGAYSAIAPTTKQAVDAASRYAQSGPLRGVTKGTGPVAKGFIDASKGIIDRGVSGNLQIRAPGGVMSQALNVGQKAAQVPGGILQPSLVNRTLSKILPGAQTVLGTARAIQHAKEGDYGRAAMAGVSAVPGPIGWAGLAGEAIMGAPTLSEQGLGSYEGPMTGRTGTFPGEAPGTDQIGRWNPDKSLVQTGVNESGFPEWSEPEVAAEMGITPDTGYRDPIMDMVAAEKPGMLGDEGFSNADIQTAQSPESKSLLEKVKSGAATAGDYVSKYGMAAWNFAKGNMMGGALSLAGGPLGFATMLGGLQKTDVTPEDKAANAAFEQKHGISVGNDGRITSGPLQGTIPAGKSFAGSANYDEMIDDKINNIKNRKAPQTDASRAKIAELEAMKTTKAAPTGIMKPGGYDEVPEDAIPEDIEDTDLMTFEQLGGWLGRDDKVPDEPTVTGIEGPPSVISQPFTPTGPTGADVHGTVEPTTPTPTVPDHISGATTSTPRGGGADVQDVGRGSPGSMPTGTGGPPGRGGSAGGPPSQGGGGGGGNGGCFVKGTPITMADGSTKPVEQIDLGDEVAEGGKVFAAGKFLTEELHDYEGIKVSGSHMVNEDGTWVRVRDSEKGKPLGDDEHTVYVFGAEHRRILINDILFTDYFEVKEQDQLATIGDKYFEEWKDHDKILVNLEEQNNVAVLNR